MIKFNYNIIINTCLIKNIIIIFGTLKLLNITTQSNPMETPRAIQGPFPSGLRMCVLKSYLNYIQYLVKYFLIFYY